MRIIHKIERTGTPVPTKKRVAAYARVSSEKDASLKSLSSQISHYSAYILKHPGWEYMGVYADAPDILGLKQNPTKRASL